MDVEYQKMVASFVVFAVAARTFSQSHRVLFIRRCLDTIRRATTSNSAATLIQTAPFRVKYTSRRALLPVALILQQILRLFYPMFSVHCFSLNLCSYIYAYKIVSAVRQRSLLSGLGCHFAHRLGNYSVASRSHFYFNTMNTVS